METRKRIETGLSKPGGLLILTGIDKPVDTIRFTGGRTRRIKNPIPLPPRRSLRKRTHIALIEPTLVQQRALQSRERKRAVVEAKSNTRSSREVFAS